MNPPRSSTVVIDRRPILWIVAERSWRFAALAALFALTFLAINRPPFGGLSQPAYRAVVAFGLCAALWLTQLIPPAITGLLAIVVIPLFGILPAKEAYSYFGNEAVFFILGAFILAAAMMKTGLSRRLALILLKGATKSPRSLVRRVLFATALFSCVMSEHAVAAFFFPIVLEIARALEFEPEGGEYGKTLFLAMAWGAIIGGIVTLLGGARAPLAVAIFREMGGRGIGFFEWMKTTVFVAIPLIAAAYFILTRYFTVDVDSVAGAAECLENDTRRLGPMEFREFLVLAVLAVTVAGWMFGGETYGLGNIAVMAVVALFVLHLVRWKDVEEYVNWGIILMYAGAICLGRAVDASGALEWFAARLIAAPQRLAEITAIAPAFWLVAIITLAGIFLTEAFSNSAVVALLLPVSLKLMGRLGGDPTIMVYGIAIASGLGFVMPMGTPAVAIAYSSGYLRTRDILVPGMILNFLGWAFFLATVWIFSGG